MDILSFALVILRADDGDYADFHGLAKVKHVDRIRVPLQCSSFVFVSVHFILIDSARWCKPCIHLRLCGVCYITRWTSCTFGIFVGLHWGDVSVLVHPELSQFHFRGDGGDKGSAIFLQNNACSSAYAWETGTVFLRDSRTQRICVSNVVSEIDFDVSFYLLIVGEDQQNLSEGLFHVPLDIYYLFGQLFIR